MEDMVMQMKALFGNMTGRLLVFTVFATGVTSASLTQAATYKLRLATTNTDQMSQGITYMKLAEMVKKKSNGELIIDNYLGSSLFNEPANIEAIKSGSVEMGDATNANWGKFLDAFLFMDLPYAVNGMDGLRKLVNGPIGREIEQKFEQQGFKILMFNDNGGFRSIYNNVRPVHVPNDLKGLKIRTTGTPVDLAIFKTSGANPIAFAWAEVYTGLSQKVIDGLMTTHNQMVGQGFVDVIKFSTEAQVVPNMEILVVSKKAFDNLPPNLQKILTESAKELESFQHELDAKLVEEAVKVSKQKGVQFYHPTAADMAEWRKMGKQVWPQFSDKVPPQYIDRVLKAQE
jgi:tripartite ATP-independent transporter DctP family solute receptor